MHTQSPRTQPPSTSRLASLSVLFAAVWLSGCGGGGGDAGTPAPPPPTDASAQLCAPTNPYLADADTATRTGTLANEKAWLKNYISAAYLWHAESPTVDPTLAAYSDVNDVYGAMDSYFNALLTPAITASGKPRDRFSFTFPTKAWNDLSQSGTVAGYGIEWYIASPTPPRGLRVAYVAAGSPAAAAGLQRGDVLVTADGAAADTGTADGVNTLNAALFPATAGEAHALVFNRGGSSLSRSLTSANVVMQPVPTTQVVTSPGGGRVGYIVFNDHIATAEAPLISAINTLKTAAVDDLVLDLRYNGGGYLYIASELAYMIAGPGPTSGQVFEQLQYSNQRAADNASPDARTAFYNTSCHLDANFNCTQRNALPTLNLSRVTVLTSPGTCSASEAIVNGLRGVNVEVRLIGGTTCGKPYGFTAKDNCGISYFPIEFKGVNAKGFGDYADGFTATCPAADDFDHALGDVNENQLSAALYNLDTNACAVAAARPQPNAVARATTGRLLRGPERESRILLPRGR